MPLHHYCDINKNTNRILLEQMTMSTAVPPEHPGERLQLLPPMAAPSQRPLRRQSIRLLGRWVGGYRLLFTFHSIWLVVIPVSSSMQGLKITLLKDTLRFLVNNLGERDRMGLVTFGSSGGGVPLVGMTTKTWSGWNKVLSSIRPVGQKSLRADVVEGANVAMDLLMQRKAANPISTILLISDSSTSDTDSVDFVVQRAEAAK